MNIYIRRGADRWGPYTQDQAVRYYAEGSILPDDMAWREGTADWVHASAMLAPPLPQLKNPPPPRAAAVVKPIKKESSSGALKVIFVVGLILLGLSFLSMQIDNQIPAPQGAVKNDSDAALHYEEGRAIAESLLKAPTTAKWSSAIWDQQHTGAAEVGNGIWQAFGTVDAENSFGVPLHSSWIVYFSVSNQVPLYAKVGDQEVGNYAIAMRTAGKPVDGN